jgi:hypothetical protein
VAEKNTSEANFRINVTGNAADATKSVAQNARLAAQSIAGYEENIKTLSADLRRLTGNSDEVNSAKKALKEQIDKNRASISLLTVELNKQGESYNAAAKAAKAYGAAMTPKEALAKIGSGISGAVKRITAPVTNALGKVTGPAAKKLGAVFGPAAKKIREKLAPAGQAVARFGGGAKKAFGVVATAAKPITGLLPSMSTVVSALGTVALTATAAVVALGAAVIGGGVALAAFGLAAADAYAKLNRQRQALLGNAADAGRLGDQIQALANKVPQGVDELNALGVSLAKTRLTGKAMVDTMNAVAQATGAVDAGAGAKLQEIVTRGQDTGRLFLGLRELQGTGIDFDDVAREYAAGTKKSIDAARRELMSGAVPLEQGAEALRKATEKKFGDLNIKNAFSLENAPKKFFEQIKSLTSGVNLEPITKGLQEAFGQLSPDAPLGRALKTFLESFVGGLAEAAGKGIPLVLEGFKWLVVGALRVGTHFYEMKKQIVGAFEGGDWVKLGQNIIIGIATGVTGAWKFLAEALISTAKNIKSTFTGELKIKSPSKVFEKYGENTTEGYAQGVERGSRRAQGAVADMVGQPGAGGAGPSVGSITVEIHGAPTGNVAEMQSPIFLAALTRALRDALNAKGLAAA